MTPPARRDRVLDSDVWQRNRLEELLSPLLAPAVVERLWAEAWGRLRISPSTLNRWHRLFGVESAALAVASGLTDTQLQACADQGPDRAVLEMLADLNCYPHITPAARPVAEAPWTKYLPAPASPRVRRAATQGC